MTEEIDRNWREGWAGRWFLYACAFTLAATLATQPVTSASMAAARP